MTLRWQLPVYSPLSLRAIAAGAWALTDSRPPFEKVRAWLHQRYQPRALLLTESGTSALALALRAATEGRRRIVALPAYCCYDVATAADGADVEVLLYDLDPFTLGPDWDSLRVVLSHGVAAVVVAHLYGVPVQLDEVRGLVRESAAVLIDDGAQGAGASFAGRPLGSHGSLGVLSFGRGKGMTAGTGGALLASDSQGAAVIAGLESRLGSGGTGFRELVTPIAQWALARPALYAVPASMPFLRLGETVYRLPGEPRRMSGNSAGILSVTQLLSDEENDIRRRNADRLLREIYRFNGWSPIRIPTAGEAGYLRLPVLGSQAAREGVLSRTGRSLGIMPGYPRPLSELKGFARRVLNAERSFSGAKSLAARLATLPTHSRLNGYDFARLERWIATSVG